MFGIGCYLNFGGPHSRASSRASNENTDDEIQIKMPQGFSETIDMLTALKFSSICKCREINIVASFSGYV